MGIAMLRLQVGVAGGGMCSGRVGRLAAALGRALADAGAVIVCGGLGGVMEAVARGARQRGGTVIGILPGYDCTCGNRFLSIAVPTGLGHARNVIIAAAGDVLVALPGGSGTLSEVALALRLGRPVVGLGAWGDIPGVEEVGSVAAVLDQIRGVVGRKHGRARKAGGSILRTRSGARQGRFGARTQPRPRGSSPRAAGSLLRRRPPAGDA